MNKLGQLIFSSLLNFFDGFADIKKNIYICIRKTAKRTVMT